MWVVEDGKSVKARVESAHYPIVGSIHHKRDTVSQSV